MKTTLKLAIPFFILLSTSSFADNQKHKDLPPGLQKKVERDGELPPGWKNKIKKGYVLDNDIFSHGEILNGRYPIIPGTSVYRVDDKVFRLSTATREILDIIK
jgi:hypothetical protein